MKIAALLNVHAEPDLVLDTIDSIRSYMTNDILTLIDGGCWDRFRNVKFPCHKMAGLYHKCEKAPYRNITFGLKRLTEMYEADWYCYIEYDCLMTSSDFKNDLESLPEKVWFLGNDHRVSNRRFPLLEQMMKSEIMQTHCFLGCCNFFRSDFINKLKEINFFERFLHLTNDFSKGFFPNFGDMDGYDFGEHLYPTLAAHLGGELKQFATYYGGDMWYGNHQRYPMRFRPEYDMKAEKFPQASIIHPVKNFDHPFRILQRKKRKLNCLNKSQSMHDPCALYPQAMP